MNQRVSVDQFDSHGCGVGVLKVKTESLDAQIGKGRAKPFTTTQTGVAHDLR